MTSYGKVRIGGTLYDNNQPDTPYLFIWVESGCTYYPPIAPCEKITELQFFYDGSIQGFEDGFNCDIVLNGVGGGLLYAQITDDETGAWQTAPTTILSNVFIQPGLNSFSVDLARVVIAYGCGFSHCYTGGGVTSGFTLVNKVQASLGSFKVKKVKWDEEIGEYVPFKDVAFTFVGQGQNLSGITNLLGEILWENIPTGEYILTETIPQDYLVFSDDIGSKTVVKDTLTTQVVRNSKQDDSSGTESSSIAVAVSIGGIENPIDNPLFGGGGSPVRGLKCRALMPPDLWTPPQGSNGEIIWSDETEPGRWSLDTSSAEASLAEVYIDLPDKFKTGRKYSWKIYEKDVLAHPANNGWLLIDSGDEWDFNASKAVKADKSLTVIVLQDLMGGFTKAYQSIIEPMLMLEWRNDNQGNWSAPRKISLGKKGDTQLFKNVRQLGSYKSRQYRLTWADKVPIIIAVFDEKVVLASEDTDGS